MTIVPLTTLSGDEYSPAFSPDGEQIAFSWNGENEDNFDLYIKLVGSAAVRRLTTHPDFDADPSWSPDGKQIAFIRWSDGRRLPCLRDLPARRIGAEARRVCRK